MPGTKLNAEWHRAHPMPKNATEGQRVEWHDEHARVCGCREIPPGLVAAVEERRRMARDPSDRGG